MARRRKSRVNAPAPTDAPPKRRVVEKAVRALEFPPDLAVGMAHIEISGNREAIIDGCRGILEYDENVIRINAGKVLLRFTGRGLTLKNLTADSAVIDGFFTAVEFLPGA